MYLCSLIMQKDTNKLRSELVTKFNIQSDRDLIKQLGIKPEDKAKLFAWIEYQNAYSFNEGIKLGREHLQEQIADLLNIRQPFNDEENI